MPQKMTKERLDEIRRHSEIAGSLNMKELLAELDRVKAVADGAFAEILMDVESVRDEKRARACVHRTATNARKEIQGDDADE